MRRSFRLVRSGAIVTASTPSPTAVSQVRSRDGGDETEVGEGLGEQRRDEPVEQEPADDKTHRGAEHADHHALDGPDPEHRAQTQSEREHGGFLARSLVGVDAGGVERDEERQE